MSNDVKKFLKSHKTGKALTVKVVPNSKKTELIITEDEVRLKTTAQPIENKANKAVIEFFSDYFKVPKSSVSILRGEKSKIKTILFEGLT